MTDAYDEVSRVVQLVLSRSLKLNPMCCATDEWRGQLCAYHRGVVDGAEMALLQLRSERGTRDTG